jgi:hypothetical protein
VAGALDLSEAQRADVAALWALHEGWQSAVHAQRAELSGLLAQVRSCVGGRGCGRVGLRPSWLLGFEMTGAAGTVEMSCSGGESLLFRHPCPYGRTMFHGQCLHTDEAEQLAILWAANGALAQASFGIALNHSVTARHVVVATNAHDSMKRRHAWSASHVLSRISWLHASVLREGAAHGEVR